MIAGSARRAGCTIGGSHARASARMPLQYLVSIVGHEHVMFGTDWPHWVHDTKGAFANTAALPQAQCRAIRGGNANRIFRL